MKAPITTAIIVHGGARTIPPEAAEAHKKGCRHALMEGWRVLQEGGRSADAVEAAVRALETDPTFNAGTGSALNREGAVELDAAIMNGEDLRTGAVAAVRGLLHPISVAKAVMDSGEAVLLVAEGARWFAEAHLQELVAPEALISEEQHHEWLNRRTSGAPASGSDTVGCVALDSRGCLAAGTSTGGLVGKLPGRVGDSPLVGCGLYADTHTAVSTTGDGESIVRVTLSRLIAMLAEQGMSAQEAAEVAIAHMKARVPGEAGCIVLHRSGAAGVAHNSSHLAYAHFDSSMKEPLVSIQYQS